MEPSTISISSAGGWSICCSTGATENSGYTDLFKDETTNEETGPSVCRNVGSGWNPSIPVDDEVDDHALAKGCAFICALHYDLTAYEFLPKLQGWIEGAGVVSEAEE